MNVIIIIIIGILFASLGQILWKIGMNGIGSIHTLDISTLLTIIADPYVITGIVCYGIGTVFWLIALSRADLSFVYPFIALTFVLIFIASFFIFHENLSFLRILGAVVIITGIVILVKG